MKTTGEHLLRDLAPQVLGAVVRRYGDFGAAEDAVQEALTAAAFQWPRTGVPENPRAWLIQVAARKLTDHDPVGVARRRRETKSSSKRRRKRAWYPRPTKRDPAKRTTRSFCSSCAATRRSRVRPPSR